MSDRGWLNPAQIALNAEPIPIPEPLLAAIAAVVLGALFVAADSGLREASDGRLHGLQERVRPALARQLERATADRSAVQKRYLLGRNACFAAAFLCLLAWLQTQLAPSLSPYAPALGAFAIAAATTQTAAGLGRRYGDSLLPLLLLGLRPIELLLAPVAAAFGLFGRILPHSQRPVDADLTEAEVERMVTEGERSGALEREGAEMIRNVLEFSDLSAKDAMVPREHVVAIKVNTPLNQIVELVTQSGHSRYPVYRDELADAFGLLYAKDLFRVMRGSWRPSPHGDTATTGPAQEQAALLRIVREPMKIVPSSQPLSSLLREMRQDRQHLAIVVDEFGDISGIVTLEDLIEEIVGDIQDEHDRVTMAPIVELENGNLQADATLLLDDLAAYLRCSLHPDSEYETLGGMLVSTLGRVPQSGTEVEAFGLQFIVRDCDEKRINTVEIIPNDPPPSSRHATNNASPAVA